MNIKLELSLMGINDAVRKIHDAKDNIEYGVEQTVDILAKNGTAIANLHYGSMAKATTNKVNSNVSVIEVDGKVPLIAEFGAGDATIEGTGFENKPNTPVFRGSYSLLVGSREYWDNGEWEFPPGSGHYMTEVQPRMGLRDAQDYIITNGNSIAQGVIKL